MKAKVLKFLQNLPKTPIQQFNEALKLYQQCETASFAQIRYLNAAGFTKYNLENLLYDLKQVTAITDKDIRAAKPKVFVKVNPFAIPVFVKGAEGNRQRVAFCKANEIEVEGKSNKIMDPAIAKWSEAMTAKAKEETTNNIDVVDETVVLPTSLEEVFTKAPGEVKEYVSLHDEFPFLDEDDCPEELKILVADKRKHYRKWVDAHKVLMVVATEAGVTVSMTNEQIFDIAVQAIENFEINQAIYEELDHYNKEGKILGEHPIFLKRKLKDGVDAMTMADAAKRQNNLENYSRRDAKALAKALEENNVDEINKLNKKVDGWLIELSLVMAKLGASAK